MHSGFDGSAEELHFFGAWAGVERGYHVLTFDGPGQPSAVRRRLMFRPDWERVVGSVLDFLHDDPGVDQDRIALLGVSFGGLLAPRAAAFEHRLAAVVAVDGIYDAAAAVTSLLPWDRDELERRAQAEHDEELDRVVVAARAASPTLRWACDHGRYVFGVGGDREFLAEYLKYTLAGGIAERISCPALVLTGSRRPSDRQEIWAPGPAGRGPKRQAVTGGVVRRPPRRPQRLSILRG